VPTRSATSRTEGSDNAEHKALQLLLGGFSPQVQAATGAVKIQLIGATQAAALLYQGGHGAQVARLDRLGNRKQRPFGHFTGAQQGAIVVDIHRHAYQHVAVGPHQCKREMHAHAVEVLARDRGAMVMRNPFGVLLERRSPIDARNAVAGRCSHHQHVVGNTVMVDQHGPRMLRQSHGQHPLVGDLVCVEQARYRLKGFAACTGSGVMARIAQVSIEIGHERCHVRVQAIEQHEHGASVGQRGVHQFADGGNRLCVMTLW